MSEEYEIKILFFARLKDLAGIPSMQGRFAEPVTVLDLKKYVVACFPSLDGALDHVLVAINRSYAEDGDVIPENSEVAFFPPVSGGSDGQTIAKVTKDEIDSDAEIAKITRGTTGAACSFLGIVRGETTRGEERVTTALEYEAYEPMAVEKMEQIAAEMRSRWPELEGIVIIQRIGWLNPGDPSTLIACTSAHRDSGIFMATKYGIDRLKEIVPVWKKEVGPGGEEWIEGEYFPTKGE